MHEKTKKVPSVNTAHTLHSALLAVYAVEVFWWICSKHCAALWVGRSSYHKPSSGINKGEQ